MVGFWAEMQERAYFDGIERPATQRVAYVEEDAGDRAGEGFFK